ncbi:MAG: lipoate--protein ligase [Thermacetogeniaceae bacterium]
MKAKIVRAASYDPWYNMAVEEYLLNHLAKDEVILYLWQIEVTVMIGKYQNAWRECRCDLLELEGGKLARRTSGGGAVFQDLGNLNFTFIADKNLYDVDKQLQTVLHAINKFGVGAQFSGRNDLTVDGKKFSGSAFHLHGESALHHGTLLIDSDLTRLARYLQVSREKIASKGVDSVRARVVNLSGLQAGITVDAVIRSLEESYSSFYGGHPEAYAVDRADRELDQLYSKHASWEWRYGETPEFDISYCHRFVWGEIDLQLSVEDGKITDAVIYSDALDGDLIESLAAALKALPFRRDAILKAIGGIGANGGNRTHIEEIYRWLDSKLV